MTHAEDGLGLEPGSFPFESHFCAVGGAKIHYVDEGQGTTLFMVHGNPTWSFLYRDVIRALRSRFRCIAIDLPGFGLSDPPDKFGFLPEDHAHVVAALLAELGVKDGVLVAHDWGGPIGLAAAIAQPGRLTRFVLGNTWAWPVNGEWHFERFSRLMGGPFGRVAAKHWNLFVNGFNDDFNAARLHDTCSETRLSGALARSGAAGWHARFPSFDYWQPRFPAQHRVEATGL